MVNLVTGGSEFLESHLVDALVRHTSNIEYLKSRGSFDPEYFDVEEVSFDDPDERWEIAFK